jgi:lipopolysaccharide transport system ATP-binding protein
MAFSIQARGLSKQYRLGQFRGGYETLREELVRLGRIATGRRGEPVDTRTLWALSDVDFDVEEGEAVGIIGRNGAGKTTLLKVLSGITEPTRGYADVRGRLGSLLEVGTGFHPELTGRENVFLNGAILGMRRSEIVRKFDDIIGFAGVERFVDTPVKRYSSGMYVRLAFSVAAHLEPEILLVDEVLAVGDAEFQKRCLGRMEHMGAGGRTVLFVSHNMAALARLCPRAILLDQGRVVMDGPSDQVIAHYLAVSVDSAALREWPDPATAPGDEHARLRSVRVVGPGGTTTSRAEMTDSIGIELTFDVLRDDLPLIPMLSLFNSNGVLVFNALDPDPRWQTPARGTHVSSAWIPANLLNEGEHSATVFVNTIRPGKLERHVSVADAVTFLVSDPGTGETSKGPLAQSWGGAVAPLLQWTHEQDAGSIGAASEGRA